MWIRLNDASGASVPAVPPPFPASLLPSASARVDEGSGDRARTEECRARLAELDRGVEALRRRAKKDVAVAVLYERESPDPEMTARVQREVDRAIARSADGDGPVKLTADCRGFVCQLAPPEGERVPMPLVKTIVGEIGTTAGIQRVDFSSRNGRLERPGYVILTPALEGSTDGDNVLRFFLSKLRRDVDGCRQRFTVAGAVTLSFVLPGANEVNEDGIAGRISFRLSGPEAATPLGGCLQERIALATASFTAPAGVTRAEASKTIEPPGPQ